MAIENLERELSVIYDELDHHKLVLPNFQRSFVWSRDKQRKLLASFIVDLPMGSLLTLEGISTDFSKRKLCYPDEVELEEKDCEFVLDGQQRLTTLRSIFYDHFSNPDWKNNWDQLFGSLRTRWFLNIRTEERDIFGLNDLIFKELNTLTDSEIEGNIEFKVIHKTKDKELHHPKVTRVLTHGDKVEGLSKADITNGFANDYLLPLWEIYKGDKGIHKKVLNKIAENRIAEIKDDLDESTPIEHYKKIFNSLGIEDCDFEEIYDDCKNKDISLRFVNQFAQLQAEWVKSLTFELSNLLNRKVPIVQLKRGEIDRAVAIFEAINRGGEPLSVYDLIVAKSAQNREENNLTQQLILGLGKEVLVPKALSKSFNKQDKKIQWNSIGFGAVHGNEPLKIVKDWFVNLLSVLSYTKELGEPIDIGHIKREKALKLSAELVNKNIKHTINSINRALCFLNLRCGVVSCKDVQYKLTLVVLGYYLCDDDIWNDVDKLNKLEYWYWSITLGGGYAKAQNIRCINDIKELDKLIFHDENKFEVYENRILNVEDYVSENILLRKDDAIDKEPTSIKNILLQFILSRQPHDLEPQGNGVMLTAWDVAFNDLALELHHLIPLARVKKIGEVSSELRKNPENILNSSLNLSYITKESNRLISDFAPAEYLKKVGNKSLASHFIKIDTTAFDKNILDKDYTDNLKERFSLLQNSITLHLRSLQ
ncbi:DUF262 domain-containing protein [Psychromonas sp. GE-S-Ul-11]|uniref:DUF262 domain-containing protein n=1 Tax=Psychromonas sp. GE-S-Ul-11 TaxID=3241170 RepID=UPI00390C5528